MAGLELWLDPEIGWGANFDGQGFHKLAVGVTGTHRLTDDLLAITWRASPELSDLGAEGTVYRLGGQAGLGVLFRIGHPLFHVGVNGIPSWNFDSDRVNVDLEVAGRYLHVVRSGSQRLAWGAGLFGRKAAVGRLGSDSPIVGLALSALADWDNFL